ncbi:MAG: peptide MFS transporter, partial [Vicinamibacterales bacterium]
MANPASTDTSFFGHPRGLSTLFFTEMWERFSYYGMRALLLLYMTAAVADGGLGFDAAQGGAIYGLYTSMAYMAALPGGWVADRLIGQRKAVLYGGIIIASGHFSMALPSLATFYLGLFLIVIGTGLLKGNVSVVVGQLYGKEDERRDAGFSIFYMGINLGAFLAPLVCGYLGQRVNWHVGFAAAGVGMTVGVVQYMFGGRYLGDAGLHPAPAASPAAAAALKSKAMAWGLGFLAVAVVLGVGGYTGMLPITAVGVADAAGVGLLLSTVIFFGWMFTSADWTPAERKRLVVVAVLFLASALFWSVF